MAEHFTHAHVGHETTWWCPVCQRETRHRVDAVSTTNPAGHLGPCLEHGPKVNQFGESKRQEKARRAREALTRQCALFPPQEGVRQ